MLHSRRLASRRNYLSSTKSSEERKDSKEIKIKADDEKSSAQDYKTEKNKALIRNNQQILSNSLIDKKTLKSNRIESHMQRKGI